MRICPKPVLPLEGVLVWHAPETDYGRTIDSVMAAIRPQIQAAEREAAVAPALLSELMRRTPAHREMLARNSRRFRNLALCGLLLERGHRGIAAAPCRGERLARLALTLIDSLDAEWYGHWALADARAQGWMLIGNARRLAADLRGAEKAFRTAEMHLRQGTGDRSERDRLLAYRKRLVGVRQ